jgi:ferredoxin-nitrite reductase
MISLFCKYGNYENRAKARTRFIQDKLGDDFVSEYRKHLDAAAAEGGLTIDARAETVSKKGAPSPVSSRRVIAQKQDGLYTVKYHPLGGNLSLQSLKNICGAISDMEDVSLRLSPDETIYIINCSGDEVRAVLDATDDSAQSDIEESVSCIGASVCQQGLRNSQELLGNILDEVKKHSFSPDALPQLHISGCMSSCGTHQIGSIGFHGKVKIIDKKPFPAFSISINGCEKQGAEHFGEDMGVMLTEDIPKFIAELGETVTNSGMSYNDFTKANPAVLTELIKKYV